MLVDAYIGYKRGGSELRVISGFFAEPSEFLL